MKASVTVAVLLLAVSVAEQQAHSQRRPAGCVDSPLFAVLTQSPADEVLRSYGYDLRQEVWACATIDSPWTTGSELLHLHKVTAQTDDYTAFSVMRVAGNSHLWVIPTAVGMLAAPHVESDPHDIAAFNALLQSFSKNPSTADDWFGVGKLYMSLVIGSKDAIPLTHDEAKGGICSNGECVIKFTDRVLSNNEPYVKWTMTFDVPKASNPPKLIDVTRDVVHR
jgi:hypothetical protein